MKKLFRRFLVHNTYTIALFPLFGTAIGFNYLSIALLDKWQINCNLINLRLTTKTNGTTRKKCKASENLLFVLRIWIVLWLFSSLVAQIVFFCAEGESRFPIQWIDTFFIKIMARVFDKLHRLHRIDELLLRNAIV